MLELQKQTGLNFQYTMMCLEANGWDFTLARSNYDELISSIPVCVFTLRTSEHGLIVFQPMIPPEAYVPV